jgi:hypothetical protein
MILQNAWSKHKDQEVVKVLNGLNKIENLAEWQLFGIINVTRLVYGLHINQ